MTTVILVLRTLLVTYIPAFSTLIDSGTILYPSSPDGARITSVVALTAPNELNVVGLLSTSPVSHIVIVSASSSTSFVFRFPFPQPPMLPTLVVCTSRIVLLLVRRTHDYICLAVLDSNVHE